MFIENDSPLFQAPASRLQAALSGLEHGDHRAARLAAQEVLAEAELSQDKALEAQSLMCLAYVDRSCGQFRRAHDTAQQATRLFRLHGHVAGEVEALTLLAQCAVNLARNEEAVEAALLSVKLGEALAPGPHKVSSLNFLGVAYLWSKSFALADAALLDAMTAARELGPGRAWQPQASLAWVEIVRLAKARYLTGVMPDTAELVRRAQACQDLLAVEPSAPLMPGMAKLLGPVVRMTQALAWCWSGHPEKALTELRRPRPDDTGSGATRAVDVLESWVYTEISWRQGDLEAAERHGRHTLELADRAEHEQLACVTHLVLAQLQEQQGRSAGALQELRTLRQREMRIRSERVESRHWVVQTALDMRSNEQSLAHMARYSKELERLSFEDPLTGLANRRRFETQLDAQLAARESDGASTLCVALIDLDEFKKVNDTHTHAAGDEVLKGVAEALRSSVRERDLPARLAGDEFVVLLPGTGLDEAERVCVRLQEAVAGLRWPHLAPGLTVSVTIGVAEAQDGDTSAGLLHRSDVAMFAKK